MEKWDEERYVELNTYFRIRIQGMVDSDPYIKDLIQQAPGLQLQDLVERMTEQDQGLWVEFLELDRIKLHIDMQNHLEGRGKPFSPRTGFGSSSPDEDEGFSTW